MKKIKICIQGFTLIELLVVVLIIGILAGIALPQYKQAVDRTEFARLQAQAKSLVDAYSRYYLSGNKFANSGTEYFDYMDVDFPYEKQKGGYGYRCRINADNYCCISPLYSDSVYCAKTNYRFGIWIHSITTTPKTWCVAKQDDPRALKLCEKLWDRNKNWQGTGFLTPDGISAATHKQYPI